MDSYGGRGEGDSNMATGPRPLGQGVGLRTAAGQWTAMEGGTEGGNQDMAIATVHLDR